jgi:hypothetical protein
MTVESAWRERASADMRMLSITTCSCESFNACAGSFTHLDGTCTERKGYQLCSARQTRHHTWERSKAEVQC